MWSDREEERRERKLRGQWVKFRVSILSRSADGARSTQYPIHEMLRAFSTSTTTSQRRDPIEALLSNAFAAGTPHSFSLPHSPSPQTERFQRGLTVPNGALSLQTCNGCYVELLRLGG